MKIYTKQIILVSAITIFIIVLFELISYYHDLHSIRSKRTAYRLEIEKIEKIEQEEKQRQIEFARKKANAAFPMDFKINDEIQTRNVFKIKETKFTYRTDGMPVFEPDDEEIAKKSVKNFSNKIIRKWENGFYVFYDYDKSGRVALISKSPSISKDDWVLRTKIEYDSKGKTAAEIFESKDSDKTVAAGKKICEYGKNGKISRELFFDGDSIENPARKIEYEYDEFNSEIKKTELDSSGKIICETKSEYDEKGILKKRSQIDSEKTTEEIFDEKANLIYRKTVSIFMTSEEINENLYAENSNKMEYQKHYEKKQYISPNGKKEWSRTILTHFGHNGSFRSKIKETTAGLDSSEGDYEIIELYDEKMHLIYEKSPKGKPLGFEAWFEYDNFGNETYKRESLGGRTRETFTQYKYYFGGLIKKTTVYSTMPKSN